VKKMSLTLSCLVALSAGLLRGQTTPPAPTEQMVSVAPDVKLQVLDWGGTGRPMIFFSGLGDDAHVYDKFAPQFTEKYHVYAITRRGFGASSKPAPTIENYNADRLGDDVLAVIDALKLNRPVLVGHSIAGEELSSVGSRHPEKISGLIYLDAGMGYCLFDAGAGWIVLDMLDLKKKLQQFEDGTIKDEKQFLHDMLAATQQFEKDLQQMTKETPNVPVPPSPPPPPRRPAIPAAIQFGEQKYTKIDVPILALFAVPHAASPALKDYPAAKAAIIEADRERSSTQANAFEAGLPSAHVVRLPNASHYIFKSNEADVVREMDAFLTKLP